VAQAVSNTISVFSRTASGAAVPLRTIQGGLTGLNFPFGVDLDLLHDEIFVANFSGNSVTVYGRTASNNAVPLRTISGGNTGLSGPSQLAVDPVNNELFVPNANGNTVTVYGRTDSNNVFPLRTITGLSIPFGVGLDLARGELFTNSGSAIKVFSRTATGAAVALRSVSGGLTGLNDPRTVAFAQTAAVPALGGWGQVAMAAALLAAGVWVMRRRANACRVD
jgi:DNA-binding beta-propeller fold protein YncE